MNSVRPLITITILAIVGGFLYLKINQAPLRPLPDANSTSIAPALESVPQLDNKVGTALNPPATPPAGTATLAPQWPSGTDSSASPRIAANEPARPEPPAIPDLPTFPNTSPTAEAPALTPPAALPTDTPPGRYGSELPSAGASATPTNAPPASQSMSSEHDSAAESAMAAMGLTPQPGESPTTPAGTAPPLSQTPTGESRYGASVGVPTQPPATNPPANDRYGMTPNVGAAPTSPLNPGITQSATPGNPLAAAAGPTQSFAASWPLIQASLQKGELVRAHLLLSPWFNEPSLSPGESQQVDALLGQLAGTVIYSTEHRLEPPYTVRPGETLDDIARQHNVPWQLLGKINSVPQASQLRPGQQLKVVRGPFEGELDLQRNLLALKIDGRYAGKFPISAPPDVSLPPGNWVVQEKPTAPATQASVYGATDPSRVAVSRSLLLRSATATAANPGVPVQIGAGPGADAAASATNGLRTAGPTPLLIKVSPRDAEDLSDILSVGSRIVIRR